MNWYHDIISLLIAIGEDDINFKDLSLKLSPHTHPVKIWRIFIDPVDKKWTVMIDGVKANYLLEEIRDEKILATIYQRLKLTLNESKKGSEGDSLREPRQERNSESSSQPS